MRCKNFKFPLFSIIILNLFFISFSTNVFADNTIENNTKLVEYKLGVALTNIGFIDMHDSSYELTFWMTIVSESGYNLIENIPKEFDYTNGNIEQVMGEYVEESLHKVKVQGVFFNKMDYRNYPFEELELAVHIEPYYPLTAKDITFTINEEYFRAGLETVSVSGWNLRQGNASVYIIDSGWAKFPHAEFNFVIHTDPLGTFIKKIFPVCILTGFIIATFWMSPKRGGDRVSVIVSSLIGAIFYHAVFFLGELPPIGYLTIADKIMMLVYTLNIYSLIVVLIHRHYEDVEKIEYTYKQIIQNENKFRILIPIIITGFVFWTIPIWT